MKTGCMNCGSDHPMYSCINPEEEKKVEPEPPKKLTTEETKKLVMERVVTWYAEHQIVRETENSWLLKKPGTNEDWAEVVSLAAGTLLVHGDHDPVMFGNMTDCRRPENVVHWMARERPDDEYFVQKARRVLGHNADELIWDQTIERFREELEEMVAEARSADPGDSTWRETLEEVLEDANDSSDDEDIRRLQDDITSCPRFDSEWMPTGRVISSRMIHAWAIIRRLSTLLKAREQADVTIETLDPITDRQREVLVCIRKSVDDHGYAPSMREIGDALGIRGVNRVNDHLNALIRKGYIEKDGMKSRALRLTKGAMVVTNASKKEGIEP